MNYFTMSVDGLPILEARLRKFRFQIKSLIAEVLLEQANNVLIPRIQEEIIEGDYIFKADLGEQPNLLDSLVATKRVNGREIQVSISSRVNYAVFFEQGRDAGDFPSGKAYEFNNIRRWLEEKHSVPADISPAIAAVMIQKLEEESDVYRNPDPVIGPAAEKYEDEYTQAVAALLNARVAAL